MHIEHFSRQITSALLKSILLAALMVGASPQWAPADAVTDENTETYADAGTYRFAMVNALTGVNPHDAKVAVKLNWSGHLESTFPGLISEFEILEDVQSAAKMIVDGNLHGLSMGIAQYLQLNKSVKLNPVFISSRVSTPLESYLLVVHRGNNWKSFSTRPSRRLVIEKAAAPNIGHMWLETLLHHQNLPPTHSYFTQVTAADKAARIVLPVFFGKADACLVPESAYHTMIELNPQIERRLDILARSPGLIKTINCATELMPDHMVERFKEKGTYMEDTIDGRQLLLIFHVKKNFNFLPKYLTESERIFSEYEELSASNSE